MRKFVINTILLFWLVPLTIMLQACHKAGGTDGEIVIRIESGNMEFGNDTKASEVTSIPSTVYWGMSYTNGTVKQSTTTRSVSGGWFGTGYYQTASATEYVHFVSNVNFTTTGNIEAYNSTDVIFGRVTSTSTGPTVTLNHIFARTGSLSLSAPSGYSISGVSWAIQSYDSISGTSGYYNTWSNGWSSRISSLGYTGIDSSSDYYLVPGVYAIYCTFTLTKGDFSKQYSQSGTVTLYAGYRNNISATTYINEATEIQFTTSVASWTSSNVEFEMDGS